MRRLRAIALVAAALVAVGSPAPAGAATARGGKAVTRTLTFDGRTRAYRVFLPAAVGRGAKLPLVLVFHGGTGSAEQVARQTGFDQRAADSGFIAAYPSGVRRTWNAGGCCGFASRAGIDDVGFVARLVRRLKVTYPVDRRRVYATGISNGGALSYLLACRLSHTFAAIGPVAASQATACGPTRPVALMHVHGLADKHVPFGGGVGPRSLDPFDWPAVADVVEGWRQADGCRGTPRVTTRGAVTRARSTRCRKRTAVQLVTIEGGGHAWPSDAFPATRALWSFFRDHPRHP